MTTADPNLVFRVDELLPQSQCRKCGHAGCLPYAEAITRGAAEINQCPPGGEALVRELSALLGVACKPVDPRFGVTTPPATAFIDEALCIGCTLCIRACPVDAIVGAAKLMHTVITRDCTGCELCLAPCPVACIAMVEAGGRSTHAERRIVADNARVRYQQRGARLNRKSGEVRGEFQNIKQRTVQRAVERAKLKLAQRKLSRT